MNDQAKALLEVTDRVLLDIKYTTDADYEKYVGCSLSAPLEFLDYLEAQKIPTTIRQVIIPTLNDSEENIKALKSIADSHKNVDKTELLPFKKICQVKYDNLGTKFAFAHLPEPDKALMDRLNGFLFK